MISVYPTRREYRLITPRSLTLEGYGVVSKAEEIAEREHDGHLRRDGHAEIDHSIAVAAMAKEGGHSASGQALAWIHDVCENGANMPVPDSVGREFGPKYCCQISYNLDALTQRKDEPVGSYFERIVQAAIDDHEVAFVKGYDRKHFHLCPYGRPEDEERNRGRRIAKCYETLGPFRTAMERVRPFMPASRLAQFDELMSEIYYLAQIQLEQLESTIPRVLL